ncbi:MAG: MBL fold metallo-hydrolase, partial [Gemmatimonadaceae bacterium]
PGVWRAEGGSHHSLVVEQPARLVVVEAPQTSARSRAVLDTLRKRFPQKPVGLVVNTHHHWDHSGGLRAYMAAGIPVVTHQRNAAFARRIAAARKTIQPDALSRSPRVPSIQQVSDSVIIGAGESRVVIYRIPTAHVEGMLGAYVPAARLLFVSDVLTPGPTLAPAGSAEVVAAVRALGVTVDRVAGGHGGVANWADIIQVTGNR